MSHDASNAVLVFGAGGHGKAVISLLRASGYRVGAVLDEDPNKWGQELLGAPVMGFDSAVIRRPNPRGILAIGDNAARRAVATRFDHIDWITLVYPHSYVTPTARLGAGTVIFPAAVIGTDVQVGKHVIVSSQCTVGHDTCIGDYAHVAAGAQIAGGVFLGTGAFLAVGSIVVPGIRIGDWATVGAGGVVVRDLPEHSKVLGMPTRRTTR